MQKDSEVKKSQEDIKRDLEASAARFKRKAAKAGLKDYYPELNQDKINVAVFGE